MRSSRLEDFLKWLWLGDWINGDATRIDCGGLRNGDMGGEAAKDERVGGEAANDECVGVTGLGCCIIMTSSAVEILDLCLSLG